MKIKIKGGFTWGFVVSLLFLLSFPCALFLAQLDAGDTAPVDAVFNDRLWEEEDQSPVSDVSLRDAGLVATAADAWRPDQ